jgi:ribosomal protein L37E
MSLIDCPECGKRVSSQAAACPACGCPLTPDGRVRTIEKTAKKYKAATALGAVLIILGLVISFATCERIGQTSGSWFGPITAFAGMLIYIVARVKTWWHHD